MYEEKKYTLEQYLTKDENGITLLEKLLKEGKLLEYTELQKMRNSVEACYIFVKYDEDLNGFDLTEEQLLIKIEGKSLIEHIVNSNCSSKFKIFNKMKNNLKTLVDLINNKKDLSASSIEKLNANLEVLGKSDQVSLMTKLNDNETLLDYLLSKNIIPDNVKNLYSASEEFIRFIASRNLYNHLKSVDERELLIEIEDNKTLLEILIDKGLLNGINVGEKKTIEILYKINRLDLIRMIINNPLLLMDCEIFNINSNTNFLEYLIDNNYNVGYSLGAGNSVVYKIIEILYNKKEYSLLGKILVTSEKLLYEINGVSMIDKLLDENIKINFGTIGINNLTIMKKIFDKNRLDLFKDAKVDMLLRQVNENETYLDYFLEAIKNKKVNFNLNEIKPRGYSVELQAKYYISVAKHDLIKNIYELDVSTLLQEGNGKKLIEILLDLDKELTLNKILTDDVKSDIKIASILKSKGIDVERVDIPIKDKIFTNEYLNEIHKKYGIGPLPEEGEYLLNKLQDLFLNDRESDKDLIEGLISGYRQALINNYDLIIIEIQNLIEIKENNPKFKYLKEEDTNCFNPNTGAIYLEKSNVSALLHETGHALHYYIAENEVPENLEDITERVRNNPEILKVLEQIANNCIVLKESLRKLVEVRCENYFRNYYTIERNNEIIEFLLKSKDEKKKEFINLGIDEECLDIILNDIFTSEEYIKTQKRIFIEQYVDEILREEYGNLLAVSDILDAVFKGKFTTGDLLSENSEQIKGIYGHGIDYYVRRNNDFYEMIANFSAIIKSPNPNEGLELLKNSVGEELYNLISEFYYNNILYRQEKRDKTL